MRVATAQGAGRLGLNASSGGKRSAVARPRRAP